MLQLLHVKAAEGFDLGLKQLKDIFHSGVTKKAVVIDTGQPENHKEDKYHKPTNTSLTNFFPQGFSNRPHIFPEVCLFLAPSNYD